MKTAISVPDDIFKAVEKLAKDTRCSRSRIFSDAVREYLEKVRNERMLEALNRAYSEPETNEEAAWKRSARKRYAKATGADRW